MHSILTIFSRQVKLTALIFAFCQLTLRKALARIIVADNTTNYKIIIPTKPTLTETKSSNELQKYIFQVSGVTMPIVLDNTIASPMEISVGFTNRTHHLKYDDLNEDGILITTDDKRLIITGGNRKGVLYATYDFWKRT